MTFLLDANVFIDFQNSSLLSQLAQAALTVPMAAAEKVMDEVTLPRPTDSGDLIGKKRAAAATLRFSAIAIREIAPDSAEAAVMKALLNPLRLRPDKDKGEAASIAVATADPTLLLVTGDRNGLLVALNELYGQGERVMRVPVFVRTLVERGAIPASVARGVAERAASHGAIPSWWASWLASL